MAHNLNKHTASGEYAFYSRKEVPWHGLGQFVVEAETASEALTLAHLDYEVKTGDVYCNFIPPGCKAVTSFMQGFNFVDKDGNIVGYSTKKGARVPKYKCLYRDDTKDVFDIVSDRYEVVQNFEALDIIYGIIKGPSVTSKDQIVIQTAGALGKGETVFVTAKMPSYMIGINGHSDPVDKYVVFTSSHDKSAQITAIVTDVRVVCNNTLQMALRGVKNKVSLRHTKNVRDRFDQFGELLGVANKYSTAVKEVLEHIATVKVTQEMINNYVYDLYVPADKREYVRASGKTINYISTDIISNKLKNKVNDVMEYIEKGPGQDVARGTAYWMYNGVTSYIHNGVKYKGDEERFSSITSGSSEILLKRSHELLSRYVGTSIQ